MNKVLRTSPPGWFWLVAILLLIWNGYGVFAYLSLVTGTADQAMPMTNAPFWATGAFAIAVFAGLTGSVGLLVKRAWARGMFIASLVATLIQQIWILLLGDWLTVTGTRGVILPLLVDLIAIAAIVVARRGIHRGWLR